MRTFHLPLPDPLHEALKRQAAAESRPATEIVREALVIWLEERRRERLADEIAAYARAEAGGILDHDEDLEAAGVELLLAADGP